MVRKILQSGNPRLRKKSKPAVAIDKKVLSLVKDLKDTLAIQKEPEGVGLAAPQIGKNVRAFVILDDGEMKAIINPKILEISEGRVKPKIKNKKKEEIMEGCLSLPHFYGPLRRAHKVTVKYINESGEEKTEEFVGFTAQIVQHEIDHLDGILFIDRLLKQKRSLFQFKKGEWEEVELA